LTVIAYAEVVRKKTSHFNDSKNIQFYRPLRIKQPLKRKKRTKVRVPLYTTGFQTNKKLKHSTTLSVK
jgi:hypothetical protein